MKDNEQEQGELFVEGHHCSTIFNYQGKYVLVNLDRNSIAAAESMELNWTKEAKMKCFSIS